MREIDVGRAIGPRAGRDHESICRQPLHGAIGFAGLNRMRVDETRIATDDRTRLRS